MLSKIKSVFVNAGMIICLLFFLTLSLWWFSIDSRGLKEGLENNMFTLVYPLMSLIGGIIGIFVSRRWGGIKSYLGNSLIFFSLGLLSQFFGQVSYAYLIYVKGIDVPYPSIGDIGYFGSIIFYIIALIKLSKITGFKKHILSLNGKLLAFFVPLVLLLSSYFFFLKGYEFDWSNSIKVFLDFGYPFGQAIYVSFALINLILSRDTLGGFMKKPISFLVFTLIIQYFCDFMFLYQVSKGEWYVGGINDYLYLCSYFCMTIAIIYVGDIFNKIKES